MRLATFTLLTALCHAQTVAQMVKTMPLRDKIAQLVMVVTNGDVFGLKTPEYEKYRHYVQDLHVGGIIVNNAVEFGIARNAEPHAMALFLNQMQRLAKTPLLVGADFEQGAAMRVQFGTPFPHNMAIGAMRDPEAARYEGEVTARQARALGVHWVFAPVADVNNNAANPVINNRSFGEDPAEVAKMVAAFIDGAHSDKSRPVLVTAKHFPGHGDTDVDSHIGLPKLGASRERMDQVELKPFQMAIAHGADAIMTAHMTVPALEPEEIPATVSPKVLTALLRDELKFKGIVVTDAMDMQGLSKLFDGGEAAVRSLLAGADVLLMPPDPARTIDAVEAAIKAKRLTVKRINESLQRVLTAKAKAGLFRSKLVDLNAVSDAIDTPDDEKRAQDIADRAVTLVKNENGVLPLVNGRQSCVVNLVSSRITRLSLAFSREYSRRNPGARVTTVDATMPLAELDAAIGDTSRCSAIVVAGFAPVSTGRGTAALGGDLNAFVEKLTAGRAPVVMVALGNPYLLTGFPKVAAYLATFSTSTPSEIAAAKALAGEIPITGRLPVSIPDIAPLGTGLQLSAKR